MLRIDGKSVGTNSIIKSFHLDDVFFAVVAGFAQALEFARPEYYAIASMRNAMVDDGGDDDFSPLFTEFAERVFSQLQISQAFPT